MTGNKHGKTANMDLVDCEAKRWRKCVVLKIGEAMAPGSATAAWSNCQPVYTSTDVSDTATVKQSISIRLYV